jgi:hypothetical protein
VGSLLQLSKGLRQAVGPAIRALKLPYRNGRDVQALLCLLRQTPNLQRLNFKELCGEGPGLLVEALRDGSIGRNLRSLSLPYFNDKDDGAFSILMEHLKAGGLRQLSDLRLHIGNQQGSAYAEALEARRTLGLAPVTRLGTANTDEFEPDILHRVWACCPPAIIIDLSACGGSQLLALGDYLQQIQLPCPSLLHARRPHHF